MPLRFDGGDECLDDAQGSPLDRFGKSHGLGALLESGHQGVGSGEFGRQGERGEYGEAPGWNFDELDLVAAVSSISVQLVCAGGLSGLAGGVDP
ncbi:hypothetical protein GCM10010289_49760 [Streptomyces violascens]|uniref:Uncharacterized protein n=2 Tax=Streptomyces violascens TaxID=67381 RepID=A0ABQ3QYJ4_9ACTN|nr:hypothetical protein GCM10010289_49760 [Streptomyces violascens]GHI42359.1 hypothetical protein Sviol_67670 [Streptomyces violascens]